MKLKKNIYTKSLGILLILFIGLNFVSCQKIGIQAPKEGTNTEKENEESSKNSRSNLGVSLENYKKLKEGMTYDQVCDFLGSEGVQDASDETNIMGNKINSVMYTWQGAGFSSITVMFQNDKMSMKSQSGLDVENSVATKETDLTMVKFNRIREGMTYEEVVKIIGGPGDELSSNEITIMGDKVKSIMYGWKGSGISNMTAMFQNDKLVSKYQIGLD